MRHATKAHRPYTLTSAPPLPASVAEVMSSPVFQIGPCTPLEEIARMFVEYGVSAVPVVDLEGELLGIVTKTDLCRAEACDRYLPDLLFGRSSTASVWDLEEADELDGLVAADVMTTDVITVETTTSPADAARLMARQRIHHLLVTRNGQIAGIVSSLDLAATLAGEATKPGGTTHVPTRAPPGSRAA